MSYLEMARWHAKELAREAFDLTEVVVDRDGDLPFPNGTAVLHMSVVNRPRRAGRAARHHRHHRRRGRRMGGVGCRA